jgi:hypothetical protein
MNWIQSLSRRLLSVEIDEVTLKTNESQVARWAGALAAWQVEGTGGRIAIRANTKDSPAPSPD